MIVPNGRPPDLVLVFPEVVYDKALVHYYGFRSWIVDCGLVFRDDMAAVLHSPHFKGEKPPPVMAGEWITRRDLMGWTVEVDFWVSTPDVTDELRLVLLPAGSKWKEDAHAAGQSE